ncbi:hypothetical protein Btru_043214 [Bulinus truncatus]|nr:hypothetical protein Btru_043214 [Bulinus truncatus]
MDPMSRLVINLKKKSNIIMFVNTVTFVVSWILLCQTLDVRAVRSVNGHQKISREGTARNVLNILRRRSIPCRDEMGTCEEDKKCCPGLVCGPHNYTKKTDLCYKKP